MNSSDRRTELREKEVSAGLHELRGNGLACRIGGRVLFSNVTFAIRGGDWLQVEGVNGAGKTSLLRLLAGLSRPHSGIVEWNGVDLAHAGEDYRRALAYLGHRNGLKEDLSALENLRLAAAVDGQTADDRAAAQALLRVGLRGREELPLRVLSQG
ncbi:MAG: ATP-binding cassette domain-containing protein, partial [Thiomonas sp.]